MIVRFEVSVTDRKSAIDLVRMLLRRPGSKVEVQTRDGRWLSGEEAVAMVDRKLRQVEAQQGPQI